MFCENCGAAMQDTDLFCINCGQAVAQPNQVLQQEPDPSPTTLEQQTAKADQFVFKPPVPPVFDSSEIQGEPEPYPNQPQVFASPSSPAQSFQPPSPPYSSESVTQASTFASPGGGMTHTMSGGENAFSDFSNKMNTEHIQRRTHLSGMLLWVVVGTVIIGTIIAILLLK